MTGSGDCSYVQRGIIVQDDTEEIMESVTSFSKPVNDECPNYGPGYITLDNHLTRKIEKNTL
jgi:hypothetical protein